MGFWGIEKRSLIIINLFLNLGFFGFGVGSIVIDRIHRLTNGCAFIQQILVMICSFLMVLYALANVWLLIKYRYHPKIRRRMRLFLIILRIFSLIWNIIFLSLLITFYIMSPKSTECLMTAPMAYLYLSVITVFMLLEVIQAIFTILAFSCLGCCVIWVWCLGVKPQEVNRYPDQYNLPYLDRTRMILFRNILGIGPEPDQDCAICHTKYSADAQLQKVSCHHYFHQVCIDTWLLSHHTCPICQTEVS